MTYEKDLQRVENALEQLARTSHSRRGDAIRSARAGVHLPRAAQVVIGQLIEAGPARISDLARAAHMSDAAVSRQVSLLEAEGLLAREPNPDDGRESIVHPTARGKRASQKLRRAADEIFREQMSDWSRSDVAGLAELIERLVQDLRTPPRS